MNQHPEPVELSADELLLEKYEAARRAILERLLTETDPAEMKLLRQREKDAAEIIKSQKERIKADAEAAKLSRSAERSDRVRSAMEAFIVDNNVVYLAVPNSYLLNLHGEPKLLKAESMMHELPAAYIPHHKSSMSLLSESLQIARRNYIDREYRIGASRPGYYNLFSADLCPLVPSDEHHFAFDVLIHSLGGGKPENVEYLEKWLWCRYNQIQRGIEDATYPALVFFNNGGGAGKGLLTEWVWPAMFGPEGVLPNAAMHDIIGNFNSSIINKVFVHINEAAIERTNSDALKQLLGSPTLTVNTKYLPAFPIANIMAVIISGNDKFSVVKLTGSKIDRRFSVMRTDLDFAFELQQIIEAMTGESVSEEDIAIYIKDVCATVFSNREEVGKWLHTLSQKYPDLLHLKALHGDDYKAAVKVQKSLHDRVIERIFDDEDFTVVDFKCMKLAYDTNFVLEGGGYSKRKRAAFLEDCKEAAEKRGLLTERGYDESRNATYVFHREGVDPASFTESNWVKFDAAGKAESKVRLD